jgi:replicative DNA helicase
MEDVTEDSSEESSDEYEIEPGVMTYSASELLLEALDYVEERGKSAVRMPGLSTGNDALDQFIWGMRPADLLVIGGRPGSGKTSFLTSMVAHVGIRLSQPVIVFCLNETRRTITTRLLSLESGVDLRTFDTGRVLRHEWPPLGEAVERISDSPIFMNDLAIVSPRYIRDEARCVMDQHGLALIVLDDAYLLQWYSPKRGADRPFSEMWFALRILARELNVPIIVTSRLSPGVEDSHRAPRLSDLCEHELEDAQVVLALQDIEELECGGDESTGERQSNVHCLKGRSGPSGMIQIGRSRDGGFRWPSRPSA